MKKLLCMLILTLKIEKSWWQLVLFANKMLVKFTTFLTNGLWEMKICEPIGMM